MGGRKGQLPACRGFRKTLRPDAGSVNLADSGDPWADRLSLIRKHSDGSKNTRRDRKGTMTAETVPDMAADPGLFSHMDIHFARFMKRLSGRDSEALFLAAALVSRATGEGHVCLDLPSVAGSVLEPPGGGPMPVACPDLGRWRKSLLATDVVGRPGDFRPLILDDRSRLYLFRYWEYENTLARSLLDRIHGRIENLNTPALRTGIERLFPRTDNGGPDTDWQKVAAFMGLTRRFCVISGGPGTGKSTVIARILELLFRVEGDGLRIALAAPTGKAAARLQEALRNGLRMLPGPGAPGWATEIGASTLHRLLGTIPGSPYFRHNADNPLPADVVAVDEASMVDLPLMSKLVQALHPRARLILVGDRDQLASVEAGAVLGDICDTGRFHGFSRSFGESYRQVTGERLPDAGDGEGPAIRDCVVQLRKSYRFGAESGIRALSRAVNRGDDPAALDILRGGGYPDIGWRRPGSYSAFQRDLAQAVLQGYGPYLKARSPEEIFSLFERFRVLCALRKGPFGVEGLNAAMEQVLAGEGLIRPDTRWYRGRPLLINRNDYSLELFNGDIGIILPDPAAGGDLRAWFPSPDGAFRKLLPQRLPEHETVFAMTVHKSQGSEFDRVLFLLPDRDAPVLTRELVYTALTRAREGVEIWGTEAVFRRAVRRPTLRASGLRDALWRE